MEIKIAEKLFEQQLLSQDEFIKIQDQQHKPVSLYYDLTSSLYLGIILLTTGLGILVYKNIDTIGHSVIIGAIAIACAACFVYCFNKAPGFSKLKVEPLGFLFDYILLLGCCCC